VGEIAFGNIADKEIRCLFSRTSTTD